MTPDQFIDAVADASNNPTPERIERVRRALPAIGTRPGGITFPRAVVDALWRRARGSRSIPPAPWGGPSSATGAGAYAIC